MRVGMTDAYPDEMGDLEPCPACTGPRDYGCALCGGSDLVPEAVVIDYALRVDDVPPGLERRRIAGEVWADHTASIKQPVDPRRGG